MRITGGSHRGQIIKTLPGLLVRPTTDKVREAIFSMLASLNCNWEKCLDLFAGSGALGIEALSRGATWVDFVDQNKKCCQIIRQNLEKTGLSGCARIYCGTVTKILAMLEQKYSIVFMDPPYSDLSLGTVITQISNSDLTDAGSVIIASHASRSPLDTRYGTFSKIKEKRYGDTCISIFRKEVTF